MILSTLSTLPAHGFVLDPLALTDEVVSPSISTTGIELLVEGTGDVSETLADALRVSIPRSFADADRPSFHSPKIFVK